MENPMEMVKKSIGMDHHTMASFNTANGMEKVFISGKIIVPTMEIFIRDICMEMVSSTIKIKMLFIEVNFQKIKKKVRVSSKQRWVLLKVASQTMK